MIYHLTKSPNYHKAIFTPKVRKFMWVATAVIIALCVLTLGYCGYTNLVEVRNSTNDLDSSIDDVIATWIKEDSEWTQLLEETDKKLEASKIRLEALGVEID